MAMSGGISTFSGDDGDMYDRNDDHDQIGDEDDGIDEDLADICQELLLKNPLDGEMKDFKETDGLTRYFEDWGESWKKVAGKDGNILHRLLLGCQRGDIKRMGHLKDAVTYIVRNHPRLLWQNQTKDNHDSPLWLAIKQKEATMVTTFMEGLKQSPQSQAPELENLLKKPVDPDGRRSMLQWAIERNLEEDAIQAMLVHVSDHTLSVQDINGRTALHAALTYGDCTDDRVRTIQQMILRANNALGVVDNSGRSIYAHHLWTHQQWLDRKRQAELRAEQEEKAKLSNGQFARDTAATDPKSTSKTAMGQTPMDIDPKKAKEYQSPKQPDSKSEALKRTLDNQADGVFGGKRDPDSRNNGRDGMSSHDFRAQIRKLSVDGGRNGLEAVDKVSRSNQGFRREPLPEPIPMITRALTSRLQDQSGRIPLSRNERDELKKAEQETKARSRGQRTEEKRARAEERLKKRRDEQERLKAREEEKRKPETLEANSQLVKLEIKLRCMRTLSPKETARILYGSNLKGELLPKLRRRGEAIGKMITNSSDVDRQICFDFPGRPTIRLEAFEMSFQSVKFDEVLQYAAFPSVKFERKTSDEEVSSKDGLGRKEMVDIFEWLRKKKKVKRIVKVIVNDFDKPAHSDKAILKSLKGFHVEELQWLKTDLDPQTILDVSKDIRKLRLRWSGSNTALRAWSDPYGLRMLQHLDTIQLDLGDEVWAQTLALKDFCHD